jgi:hypothetical protein
MAKVRKRMKNWKCGLNSDVFNLKQTYKSTGWFAVWFYDSKCPDELESFQHVVF